LGQRTIAGTAVPPSNALYLFPLHGPAGLCPFNNSSALSSPFAEAVDPTAEELKKNPIKAGNIVDIGAAGSGEKSDLGLGGLSDGQKGANEGELAAEETQKNNTTFITAFLSLVLLGRIITYCYDVYLWQFRTA
jgi:hypothetical protein